MSLCLVEVSPQYIKCLRQCNVLRSMFFRSFQIQKVGRSNVSGEESVIKESIGKFQRDMYNKREDKCLFNRMTYICDNSGTKKVNYDVEPLGRYG